MDNEKFSVVGTSLFKGATKVRFANDFEGRVKNLTRGGHNNIELFRTPNDKPLTKPEAIAFLQTQTLSKAAAEAVANKASEYAPKIVKAPTKAKDVKAPTKAKVAKTPKAVKPATKTATKTTKVAKTIKAVAPTIAQKAKAAKAAKAAKVTTSDTIVTPVTNAPAADDVPAIA